MEKSFKLLPCRAETVRVILTQTTLKMGSGGLLWAVNTSLGFFGQEV